MIVTLDMETYSAAGFAQDPDGRIRGVGPQGKGGLPVVGTPQYAAHPSTEILCASYDWYGLPVSWVPGSPAPVALLEHVQAGGMIRAYNVTFEFWLWNMVGARLYGWPVLQLEQCVCDMAAARRFSLPGSLANVAKVLGTPGKDKDGTRLIQKLTRPHTPTRARSDIRWTPATAWDDFTALYRYCDQDVIAEDAASALVPELSDHERQVWLTDQTINVRGVQVDVETLDAALSILGQAETRYNAELAEITGGAVQAASETIKLRAWILTQGVDMPNMQKETVADYLDGPIGGPVERTLQIRQLLGSANIKKLRSLKLQTSSDGRLRDQYMYCGADRTGRWSAGGVQLQNLTGKGPDAYQCSECDGIFGRMPASVECCPRCGSWLASRERIEWGPIAAEWAIQDIRTGQLDVVLDRWGDAPLDVLCGCLRALFIAAPGKELICVDFSAIEAVVAACISRCQWRIDVFNSGRDIYLESISRITGTPTTDAGDRKIGKVAELASGYGGWIGSWVAFGAEAYMDESQIKDAILAWREASPEIVEAWGGQYRWCGPGKWDYRPELHGLEGAAIQAILAPDTCFSFIDITYAVYNDILYCRRPSGRYLHYHAPRLDTVRDKLNRGDCFQITFEGYNSNAQKGPIGWHRMETYGGRLFENVCQAIGRDFQADAMVRAEAAGYPVVMHTHDELTAEIEIGRGSVEHLTEIMTERPSWASWWPINGAGWSGQRYRKD